MSILRATNVKYITANSTHLLAGSSYSCIAECVTRCDWSKFVVFAAENAGEGRCDALSNVSNRSDEEGRLRLGSLLDV